MRNGSGSRYLDASVLVAVLTVEPFSERADRFVRDHPIGLIISDFAAAEFASAIARRVRMREVTVDDARSDLSAFDSWAARSVQLIEVTVKDVALATAFLRRLDLTLRTPDAIHIAIAQRINATLGALDRPTVIARLNRAAIASARVNPIETLATHEQLRSDDRWTTTGTEAGPIRTVLPPWVPPGREHCLGDVPALGQHTGQVLDWLGLSDP